MTNGEYWKDEILKITRAEKDIAIVNNEPVSCESIDCSDCDFRYDSCTNGLVEWLYSEHIEKPTLTKKERMFCEAVGVGSIARDGDGKIFYYQDNDLKKSLSQLLWQRSDGYSTNYMRLNGIENLKFDFIKWEDEKPWTIEELLKLVVEEKDN